MTGEIKNELNHIAIFPASHYVVSKENMDRAIKEIEDELENKFGFSKAKISFWRLRGFLRGRTLTSRCSGKPDFVRGLKTIPVI